MTGLTGRKTNASNDMVQGCCMPCLLRFRNHNESLCWAVHGTLQLVGWICDRLTLQAKLHGGQLTSEILQDSFAGRGPVPQLCCTPCWPLPTSAYMPRTCLSRHGMCHQVQLVMQLLNTTYTTAFSATVVEPRCAVTG